MKFPQASPSEVVSGGGGGGALWHGRKGGTGLVWSKKNKGELCACVCVCVCVGGGGGAVLYTQQTRGIITHPRANTITSNDQTRLN